MTFGIQSTEPLLEGLSREVHELVQQALDELSPTAEPGRPAHASRRTIKRARALLKLARRSLTADAYRQGNVTMRDAGRCVGPMREADVLVETARSVRGQGGEAEVDGPWTRLLEELENGRDSLFATAPLQDGPFGRAQDLLRSVAIGWPEVGQLDDRELLCTGLETSYEVTRIRGERAFGGESDAKACHELRKRVKDLRHQIEFFASLAPETLEPIAEDLHHLGDLLGDANDLVVLAQYVESARGISDGQNESLVPDLHGRCHRLWEEAAALGARLLSEETREFVGRVEECWVAARPQG